MSVLVDARAELVARGRGRNKLINQHNGCVCPLGAIGIAAVGEQNTLKEKYSIFYDWSSRPARQAVNALVQALSPKPHFSTADRIARIYQFNDNTNTTDQDVLDLFDRAIAAEQSSL